MMTVTPARRAAYCWRRRPWLICGCSDTCRCDHRDNPTEKRVDGYLDAVDHLDRHGLPAAALLPECRALHRRGGQERDIAEALVRRWSA